METIEKVDNNDNQQKKNHYVNNASLLREIILSKERDQLTNDAIKMLELMIVRIASKKMYVDTDAYEDCKAHAMLDCALYWRGFNPEKSKNAFAYYTSIIANGLAKGWNACHPEKKKAEGAIFTSLNNNIHSI